MVFKGCTRCRGDLYVEDDIGFRDLVCLQCGSRRSLIGVPDVEDRQDEANVLRWLEAQPNTVAA